MQTINWLELHPQQTEVDVLNERLYETLPARKVRQLLAYITLQAYPWEGHTELIPFYHPTQTYRKGEWVALPVPDPQKIRPMVWQIARVIHVEQTENPIQGKFQALTLEYYGRHIHVVSDIPDAQHFNNLDFTAYSPEDLAWVAVWAADTFAKSLQIILDKLVKAGQLRGQFVGEIFIPSHVAALEPKKPDRFFHTLSATRPWVGLDEMLSSIPELSEMAHEKALALLRASLFESSYKPLGNDRWTTPVLFEQLNREVPRGLPTPHIRSKLDIWTDQDVRDFEHLPQNEHLELKPDDGEQEGSELTQPITEEWRPPNHPLRLPTLNYLHITWAYFPIDKFPTAFHPQAKLLFIQVIDGERLPFLLDRDQGMLKALDIEKLRIKFLESDLPAGTYLWLEYQGGENYRIAPRPRPTEIWVPCKQAYMESGELRITHTEIPMRYEGDASVFKADMRFEDIEALFTEAHRVNLSIRDTIIFAVQELCASDPYDRAHRQDIFNAVFLKRMCSYNSVQTLLYTQPCFEQLSDGYFRYNPFPQKPVAPTKKQAKPVVRVWNNFQPEPARPKIVHREVLQQEITKPSPVPPSIQDKSQPIADESIQSLAKNEKGVTEPHIAEDIKPQIAYDAEITVVEETVPLSSNVIELLVDKDVPLAVVYDSKTLIANEDKIILSDDILPEDKFSPVLENRLPETSGPISVELPAPTIEEQSKHPVAYTETFFSEIPTQFFRKQTLYRRVLLNIKSWLQKVFGGHHDRS